MGCVGRRGLRRRVQSVWCAIDDGFPFMDDLHRRFWARERQYARRRGLRGRRSSRRRDCSQSNGDATLGGRDRGARRAFVRNGRLHPGVHVCAPSFTFVGASVNAAVSPSVPIAADRFVAGVGAGLFRIALTTRVLRVAAPFSGSPSPCRVSV